MEEYDNNRLEKITKKIKEIQNLHHLFKDDFNTEYVCLGTIKSRGFSHLQKCIILASQYKILEEYIDAYLAKYPERANYQNDKGWTALMLATVNSSERIVEILLKHNANVNIQCRKGHTALILASKYSSTDKIVELLLKNGADITIRDSRKCTALMYATNKSSEEKNFKMINLILSY